MNCLQAALLEHNFVIHFKKGAIMPAYQTCHQPTNTNWQKSHIALTLSNQNYLTCKRQIPTFKRCTISGKMANDHQMSQNQMQTIRKIWLPNSNKMPTKLFGSGLTNTNVLEQHYSSWKFFAKWHFVKLRTINLEFTMQLLKLTFG
jgi:hypothetical protein